MELLHEKNLLDKVICMSFNGESNIPAEKIVQIRANKTYSLVDKLFKKLLIVLPSFNKRHYLELFFDRIAYRHLDFNSTKLVYSSKPLFSYSLNKCKSNNIKIILRASIAHPLFNYTLIRNEQLKLNIPSSGSYTDIKRVLKITETYHLADKIMVNYVRSADEFLVNTYKPYINPEQLILYRFPFIRLNKNTPVTPNLSGDFLFIHVARMGLIKNTHFLVETWEEFTKYGLDAQLLLIGNFDDNLKQILTTDYLNKIPNLKHVGVVDNPFGRYIHANAFICPSMSDMGPNTVIESLSAGIPVICSKSCGLSNLIEDKKNGMLFEFNDKNSLIKSLLWFVEHRHLQPDLRVNAYNTVQELSLENYKKEMWEVFKKEI
jgi:glycosyltransferase involved in cell wall biosynthesis